MVSPALATEDFTGANGTALPTHNASWTEITGSLALSSNAIRCDGGGAGLFSSAYWNACAFDDDQFSEAVVRASNPAQYMGVSARNDSIGGTVSFYIFWANSAEYRLNKLVNGVNTSIAGPIVGGVSAGDVMRIECEGTTIRCIVNGTLAFSRTDSSIASGAPGLGSFFVTTTALLDDWAGGDLVDDVDPWDAQRSSPQTSKMYLVIQQPQYSTNNSTWTGYDWSCRVNGAPADDPEEALTVDAGGAAVDLLDGQTVLISSSAYGEWDSAVGYVRGDQTVGPATTTLNIALSSEMRGHVGDDDYVVVLDEFRFRQRYGRIAIAGGEVVWYKDYDIEWDDIGAADAGRRLAMMPPTPIMGTHGVKFVEIGSDSASFYWDWANSYATAPGEATDEWVSEGEEDHAGNTWNSVAETPGWKMVNAISGLRGFRTVLEVDDGNGNATTLPYRRGVRYVFTLRRPGETQVGDPDNAEPIIDFELNEPIAGSFEQGYWRTSITVFESEASKYNIMPEALVVLFTEDTYGTDSVSVGPIDDRENIVLVGRIVDGTIRRNAETGDVTFEVASPGAEAAMYHNYPVVIQNDDTGTTWIDTPDLTVDRAVHYYTTWHTTLNLIADLYQTDSTIEIYAQDFLEGTIYDTLNQFLWDRLFARLLCDKYGRFHCEIDAQEQAFGSIGTTWTMASTDWLDEVIVRQRIQPPVNAVEAGGLIYAAGEVTPKLSRAPGLYDKYRGTRQESNALAIVSQDALNTSCGRHLSALNHEFEASLSMAGNWRYLDIAPQMATDLNSLSTHRATLTGDYLVRAVSFTYDPVAGTIFTDIETEQEADDGVPGVTIPIPDAMPDPDYDPGNYGGFGGGVTPISGALIPSAPPAALGEVYVYATLKTDADDYYTADITASPPVWVQETPGDALDKTCMMYGSTNRFFGYGDDCGIYEYQNLPLGAGAWAQIMTADEVATACGDHQADYWQETIFRMQFSIRPDQEEWAWAGVQIYWDDGDGDTHYDVWVLHTKDAWDNIWYAVQLFTFEDGTNWDWAQAGETIENGLALDMHSNTVYVCCGMAPTQDGLGAPLYDGWWRLYRSQDFGATFQLAQSEQYTWGVDGYEWAGYSDGGCDVWVPWVSNTYNGGAVFWTAAMLDTANNAGDIELDTLIYRSLNHGLSYTRIGDDGGLDQGLNYLNGPWNSLHRVWGGLSMTNGLDADQTKIWTWRNGYNWTEFRDTATPTFRNCYMLLVCEQDGYTLESCLSYEDPYLIESSTEENKACTEEETSWFTVVTT